MQSLEDVLADSGSLIDGLWLCPGSRQPSLGQCFSVNVTLATVRRMPWLCPAVVWLSMVWRRTHAGNLAFVGLCRYCEAIAVGGGRGPHLPVVGTDEIRVVHPVLARASLISSVVSDACPRGSAPVPLNPPAVVAGTH